MGRSNFAMSWEGRRQTEEIGPDFSFLNERAFLSETTTEEFEASFNSTQNILDVVHGIMSSLRPSDRLLYSAASALQRRRVRHKEAPEEWIDRVSETFFSDLDDKS